MRVASQVKKNEVVVDMFAGVGPYSILIAKKQPTAKVFSIDLNPVAYKYLQENVFLNKVADRVMPMMGDARELASFKLRGVADRIIMNFPSDSIGFLDAAINLLKMNRGVLHFYCFEQRDDGLQNVTDIFRSRVEAVGRKVKAITFARVMKEVAPNRVEVILDASVK
jgi:tRNA (guanine37-N1)-methyltransferase